jgi:processive 1,2-diacylglycerol beta-glucosyltransferase
MNRIDKRVAIVFFDAASGHRSAAVALKRALAERYPRWQVDLVNIVDVFDHHKRFGRVARYGIDRFNGQLKKDKVFDLGGQINLSLLCHDLLGKRGIELLSRFWADAPPDAVVSVTPMYNPALYRSVRLVNPNAVCVTIPVDFEEVKPRYWFTPKVEQQYLNGTDRLMSQARRIGIPASHNHRLTGMIVDPSCYQAAPADVPAALRELGLDPTLPTGLMSFGGQGCTIMQEVAQAIAGSGLAVNMIFLCGHSTATQEAISRLTMPYPVCVLGYLPETPVHYLHLADFAIGKPGTMTITEALITKTPLVAIKSRGMRLVQRGNEAWLVETGVGLLANGIEQVVPAIRQLLTSPDDYQRRIAQYTHRAVFEAADLLGQLIN